ncbi:hypothetical protein C0J52_17912 [Blattella germanica]|nr:hypothetical protein C0J52_17912 [Blattella germanica]
MLDELEECKEELDADGKDDDVHCVMECVAKKLNMLDSKGFLKADKITEFVPGLVEGDSKLEELLKSFTDNTLSAVNNVAAGRIADNAFAKCNFVLQLYLNYIFRLFILQCPEEMENNNRECNKLREKVQYSLRMKD